jgi:hypothetical protein
VSILAASKFFANTQRNCQMSQTNAEAAAPPYLMQNSFFFDYTGFWPLTFASSL